MRLALILPLILATSCALPRYKTHLTPFEGGTPKVSAEQAATICRARASMAGQAAEDRARTRAAAEAAATRPAPSFDCTRTGSTTSCTPATRFEPGADPYEAAAAGNSAAGAALRGCLAEHGWRVERVCVKNCRAPK